jgi:nucleoid DNA-binding protein
VCGRTGQNETNADYENGGLSLFGDFSTIERAAKKPKNQKTNKQTNLPS